MEIYKQKRKQTVTNSINQLRNIDTNVTQNFQLIGRGPVQSDFCSRLPDNRKQRSSSVKFRTQKITGQEKYWTLTNLYIHDLIKFPICNCLNKLPVFIPGTNQNVRLITSQFHTRVCSSKTKQNQEKYKVWSVTVITK